MRKLYVIVALALAFTTGCGTVGVRTASVEDLSNRHYSTFNFKTPAREFNPEGFTPENQKRVQQAIRSELEDRGLRMADHSDLSVGFYLRVRNKQFDLEHPTAEGDSPANLMNSYYGFVYGSGKSLNQQKSIHYKEGSLVVDLVDAKNNEVIWQGMATGALHPKDSEADTDRRIREAVREVLRGFPTQRGSNSAR